MLDIDVIFKWCYKESLDCVRLSVMCVCVHSVNAGLCISFCSICILWYLLINFVFNIFKKVGCFLFMTLLFKISNWLKIFFKKSKRKKNIKSITKWKDFLYFISWNLMQYYFWRWQMKKVMDCFYKCTTVQTLFTNKTLVDVD